MVKINTIKMPVFAMRTLAFALFAAMLLCGVAFASVNPKVQLQNYSLSESPAQPGHVLILKLHMKSMEPDNCAERVAVQLSVSYPLSISGSDTQYLESLCYRDPDSAGDFTFSIPVDNLAVSGTYPISVATTYEKKFTKLSESNTINVRVGGSPSFTASVSSSSPVDIYPGDSAKATVTFQNIGSSRVTSARATATSNYIEVKWAGRTADLGEIPARGSASATFSFEAPKNLPAGNYPVSVLLEYAGEDKAAGSAQFEFSVPIKAKADFEARSASGALLAGQKRETQIAIKNTGTQDARKLQVRIKPLFPFSTDGTVRYIDYLAAGEEKNLTYLITVDKEATQGEQLIGVLVDFEDPQGNKMSDSADFAMPVRAPTIAEELTGYWYVGALVLIAALFVGAKKMAAKKPK
ncbi:Uncharacterised protein [Candidatus Anstonella stagnisolia]|nr:Uncharacterised protein [Candidatus Anstonella stagnisolia]